MRKFILLFIGLQIMNLSTNFVFATPRDIQLHWAGTAANTLIENNIISGYEDGRFKLSRSITREEACVLLVTFASKQGWIQEDTLYLDQDITFPDVKNSWSLKAIQYMYRNHMIDTYDDGTLQPNTYLTRESMACLLYNFCEHFGLLSYKDSSCPFTDIQDSSGKMAIVTLYKGGVLHGYQDNTFRPKSLVPRAEIVSIIFEISKLTPIQPTISLPEYRVIQVPYISQVYPVRAMVGCEGTSLLMGLKAKGYAQDIGLREFLNNLPRHSSNPAKGFVGSPFVPDPKKLTRTTIYPPILTTYAQNYGNVSDFSGSSAEELRAEILDGNPVVVYVTLWWETPIYRYYNIEGEQQRLLSNNHIVLACGYDTKANKYYISDPYNVNDTSKEYKYWIDGDIFDRIYNERKQALVIE